MTDQTMLKSLVSMAACSLLTLITATGADIQIHESFATDPLPRWTVFGDPTLFKWDSSAQQLDVTWDSARPKSFFFMPLDRTVGRDDSFTFEFDLTLNDIVSGNEAGKNGPMQIGIGFLNSSATNADWSRADWPLSANVAEFNTYPSGFYPGWPVLPTTAPAFVSSSGYQYAPMYLDEYVMQFPLGQLVHVSMSFNAASQTISCSWKTNGVPAGAIHRLSLEDPQMSQFGASDDFRVNIFSISSYKSNEGSYANSVLAHGTIDNISVVIPESLPVSRISGGMTNGHWQVVVRSHAGWSYLLQKTRDYQSWEPVGQSTAGTGGELMLSDPESAAGSAFYRVQASQ